MKKLFVLISFLMLTTPLQYCKGQSETEGNDTYSHKTGDSNGIGKWYMGREIAHVMGFQGMSWLERPEREAEENPQEGKENIGESKEDRESAEPILNESQPTGSQG